MRGHLNLHEAEKQNQTDLEPGSELHVVKVIILREGYLQRLQILQKIHKSKITAKFEELLDLLDIFRMASVEAVEAIVKWKRLQAVSKDDIFYPSPFLWNGFNYLLKMPSDLDFLEKSTSSKFDVGFSLKRNPFVIPNALERFPCRSKDSILLKKQANDDVGNFPQFSTIGGRKQVCTSSSTTPRVLLGKKKKEKSKQQMPYSNNALPSSKLCNNNIHTSREKRDTCDTSECSVSFISDADMIRIRDAEKIIIAEEELYGQFVREGLKIIPAWKEGQTLFSSALKIDDFRPLKLGAKIQEGLAPFAVDAGCGYELLSARDLEKNELPLEAKSNDFNLLPDVHCTGNTNADSGGLDKFRFRKYGGELYLPSESGTVIGRKRPPLISSQLSIIDLVINRKMKENKALREDLKCAKENVEGEPPLNVLKVAWIDSQINYNEELILKKEERLCQLKEIENGLENRRRARLLETRRRLMKEKLEDPSSLEEVFFQSLEHDSITALQKMVRGMQQRKKHWMFKKVCNTCATKIQSGYRGLVGRRMTSFTRKQHWSVIYIQRNFRGFLSRCNFGHTLEQKFQQKSVLVMQRHIRGLWGRRRARRFKKYQILAAKAANAVAHRELEEVDLMELAATIEDHIVRGNKKTNFLLYLIRIVCLLIGSIDKDMSIISYDYLKNRSKVMIDESLTWENAIKILRRSHKLLYLMRMMALGPTQRIPHLLSLTEKSIHLFIAYKHDSFLNLESCRNIAKGSKAACKMMIWVDSLVALFDMQKLFHDDIKASIPFPLALTEAYKKRRSLLVQMMIVQETRTACNVIQCLPSTLENTLADDMVKLNEQIMVDEHRFGHSEQMLENLESRLIQAGKALTRAKVSLREYQEDLDIGLVADLDYIKQLKLDVEEKKTSMISKRSTMMILKKEHDDNIAKLKICSSRPDKQLHVMCQDIGKLGAHIEILEEGRKARCTTIKRDERLSELCNDTDEELIEISKSIGTLTEKKKQLEICLWKTVSRFEHSLLRKCTPITHVTSAKFNEDIDDEEKLAQEEMNAVHSYVSRSRLETKRKYKSNIIMLDKNLPLTFRDKLFESLFHDLQGLTVRVIGKKENLGIDPKAYQEIIDTKQLAVTDVEVGMTFDTRRSFTQGLIITKNAIDPSPLFMCVLGHPFYHSDHTNLMSNVEGSKVQCGTYDCHIKASIVSLGLTLQEFSSPGIQREIEKLGREEVPPSITVAVRVEALVAILSSKFSFVRTTEEASGWKYLQEVLLSPKELEKVINSMNFLDLPPNTIKVLQDYLAHEDWLGKRNDEEESQVSLLFRLLIEQIVSLSKLVEFSGGYPNPLETCKDSSGRALFDMVIQVPNGDFFNITYNNILSTLLQPATSIKKIKKWNIEFTISIHDAYGFLFFFVYLSGATTVLVMTKLNWNEVDLVLGLKEASQGWKCTTLPVSRNELYERLLTSLSLQKRTINDKEVFILEWKKYPTLLLHEQRCISGYLTTMSASRTSTNDLTFEVYFPECSNTIDTAVGLSSLQNLLNSKYENECLKGADVKILVKLVSDRLIILPSTRSCLCMGLEAPSGAKRRIHPPSQKYVKKKETYQIRTKSNPGRHVFTCMHVLAGIHFLVTVREHGYSRDLLILAYILDSHKRVDSHKLVCLITAQERVTFFNPNTTKYIEWQKALLVRLCTSVNNMNRPHDTTISLELDRSVYRSITCVGGRIFYFNVIVNVKENYIEVHLEDRYRKERYGITVTNEYVDIHSVLSTSGSSKRIKKVRTFVKEILDIIEHTDGEGLTLKKSHCKGTVRIKKLVSTKDISAKNSRIKAITKKSETPTSIMLSRREWISQSVCTEDANLNIRLYKNIETNAEIYQHPTTKSTTGVHNNSADKPKDILSPKYKHFSGSHNIDTQKKVIQSLPKSRTVTVPHTQNGEQRKNDSILHSPLKGVECIKNTHLKTRGNKILRKVFRVNQSILYISVFVLRSASLSSSFPYSFRIVGFDKSKGQKLELLVSSDTAGELFGDVEKYSNYEAQYRLADDLCRHLILTSSKKDGMVLKLF